MDLRRLAPLALLVPAVAAGATLKPKWPSDQTLRYDLGAAAARVDELDVRWAPYDAKATNGHADDVEWAREATFRYVPGRAPRTVSHVARLPSGDYALEAELHAAGSAAVVHRRVTLDGAVTTIDLGSVVP